MHYMSTRGGVAGLSFRESVMMGLGRDGGLLLPEAIPDVSASLPAWSRLTYQELAFELMRLFVDLPDPDLKRIIHDSYATFRDTEITPVREVGDVHIVELFHGPTLAFKDVALQFLGNLFEYFLAGTGESLNILGATSGDTGSAAIHGVRGKDGMRIFVMHPRGRVSRTQERQMTSVLDDNVFNIAVDGTFDDCQRIMKELFSDLEFKDRHGLGAVNSINWARLMAQLVYYFYATFRVQKTTGCDRVRFAVPTGNFGDVFAGYLAARMGLPISRLILATNENDILARFFTTGVYSQGKVMPTISPSMDIQVASNFERYLYYRSGGDPEALQAILTAFEADGHVSVGPPCGPEAREDLFLAGVGNTPETLATIRDVHARHGYLLDPHSAVGVCVGRQHLDPSEPMLCLATAHPAKFDQAIREATGRDLAHHPVIDALADLPTRCQRLPNAASAIRAYLDREAGRAA